LTVSAIAFSSGKVLFDRIERTNLNALIAVNTAAFDFPFADTKKVEHGQHCTTWADIAAPETPALQAQQKHAGEHPQRRVKHWANGSELIGSLEVAELASAQAE
jgi:hypothetical protein